MECQLCVRAADPLRLWFPRLPEGPPPLPPLWPVYMRPASGCACVLSSFCALRLLFPLVGPVHCLHGPSSSQGRVLSPFPRSLVLVCALLSGPGSSSLLTCELRESCLAGFLSSASSCFCLTHFSLFSFLPPCPTWMMCSRWALDFLTTFYLGPRTLLALCDFPNHTHLRLLYM